MNYESVLTTSLKESTNSKQFDMIALNDFGWFKEADIFTLDMFACDSMTGIIPLSVTALCATSLHLLTTPVLFLTKSLVSTLDYSIFCSADTTLHDMWNFSKVPAVMSFSHDLYPSFTSSKLSSSQLELCATPESLLLADITLLTFKIENQLISSFNSTQSFIFYYLSFKNSPVRRTLELNSEFSLYLITLLSASYIFLFLLNTTIGTQLSRYYTTYYRYLLTKATELDLDYKFMMAASPFILLVWFFIIFKYDEYSHSYTEFINSWFFFCFLFSICYVVFKLCLFILCLLELTLTSKSITHVLIFQYFRDLFALLSFVLRIASLLIRLTLYDLLEDIIESYYVFFEDFYDKSFIGTSWLTSCFDGYTDLGNDSTITTDSNSGSLLPHDFYMYYVKIVAQFLVFFPFLIDELFRLSLGTFIAYTILIEIYSGSLSYSELTLRRGNRLN